MKYLLLILPLIFLFGFDQQEHVGKNINPVDDEYKKPYKYIGQSVTKASELLGKTPNKVGNIIFNNGFHNYVFESRENIISYVEVTFEETSPCNYKQRFKSDYFLTALGINPKSLDIVSTNPHAHIYYDHINKLKIGVSCAYEGGSYRVYFSSKYYKW